MRYRLRCNTIEKDLKHAITDCKTRTGRLPSGLIISENSYERLKKKYKRNIKYFDGISIDHCKDVEDEYVYTEEFVDYDIIF